MHHRIHQEPDYLSINSVRTNGPTLSPNVWLPYAPKYVEKPLTVPLSKRVFNIFGSVWKPCIGA